MAWRPRSPETLDTELADLPPEQRWRTWMGRVEAVIFASPEPVGRDVLGRVIGRDCNLELLIDDIRTELVDRPYELVAVAGAWQQRTKKGFAEAIQAATGLGEKGAPSRHDNATQCGLRFRVFGETAGLEWDQENLEYLRYNQVGQPSRTISRGHGAGIGVAAGRFVRMPRGHPEALTDAWANLYTEFAVAVDARRSGRSLPKGFSSSRMSSKAHSA